MTLAWIALLLLSLALSALFSGSETALYSVTRSRLCIIPAQAFLDFLGTAAAQDAMRKNLLTPAPRSPRRPG